MGFLDLTGEDGTAQNNDHAAGLGSFRLNMRRGKPAQGGSVDFSLLHAGHSKSDVNLRLDPSQVWEGAAAGVHPHKSTRSKQAAETADETDPITHFKHLGLFRKVDRKGGKKIGYNHRAAVQSWTWQQSAGVIESLREQDNKPAEHVQKWSVGADGNRIYNMFGEEDLLLPARSIVMKSDRPANEDHIIRNDKAQLPYCVREGNAPRREVHQYYESDRMTAVLRYQKPEDIKEMGTSKSVTNAEKAGREAWSDEPLHRFGKRVANFGYEFRKSPCPQSVTEDLPPGWRVLPISERKLPQTSQHQVNEDIDKGNSVPQKGRWVWKPDEPAALDVTPRSTSSMELRDPALSMTPQNIFRCSDASPRSMTPRSLRSVNTQASTRSSAAETPRLKQSASAPRLGPPVRDAASQVAPTVRPSAARGGVTPRSMTPHIIPQSTTPRGNTTPRSMTPRSTTPRGEAVLNMTPQLITRQDLPPRNATPRGQQSSLGSIRSCASEVAFRCGS